MPEGRVILPRCHCGWTLPAATEGVGFACPRCHRTYADGAPLLACRHVRIDREYVADGVSVACRDCGRSWWEVNISEVTT